MLVAVLFLSISSNIYAQLTRHQAIDKVLNEIVVADTGHIDVWSIINLLYYQDTIDLVLDAVLECPYNYNWVFFVNDHPNAGWMHPCRYIFIDSVNGEYQVVDEYQYPTCFRIDGSCDYELVMEMNIPNPIVLPPSQRPQSEPATPNDHLYAVIIITQDYPNLKEDHPNTFWYDASLVYNTLIQKYGYKDENIYVHYGSGYSNNGSDLDGGEGDNHIDFDAYIPTFLETFENMAGDNTNPDINELHEDDQLFVYIDGQGYHDDDYDHSVLWCLGCPDYCSFTDHELAFAVKNINCAQMVFLIQPSFSGNFATRLTDYDTYDVKCKNRVVHTATTGNMWSNTELYLTGQLYGEFTFYWAAAVRGVYPIFTAPWEESDYETGSFRFDELYPDDENNLPEHPDDYNPDDPNETGNGDGVVQMEEAFLYADDMDIWSSYGYYHQYGGHEEPVSVYKIGYDENELRWNNLITLYGLAGSVLDDDLLFADRNYMAGNTITVEDGNGFTIEEDANFYITGEDGRIDVNYGGEFELEENVNVYNNELNISGLLTVESGVSFHDQEINITGELDIEPNVTFNNTVVNLLNPGMVSTFNLSTFNSGYFTNYGAELNITNSDFNNCIYNYSYAGDINISQSDFYNCWLLLENASGVLTSAIDINNCVFLHDDYHTMAAIDIWNYNNLLIHDNVINGYYNGIQLLGSGQYATMTSTISDNEIKNCTRNAIAVVGSNVNLSRNFIHNNYYGLSTVNNSNVAMVGDCNANLYSDINFVTDNEVYEIYATNGSFPWNFRFNAIIDEDNQGNPNDPLIYIDPVGGIVPKTYVKYNCWGNNFNPSDDFNPSGLFIYSPTWCPGDGCQKSTELALQTMLDGIEYIENEDYAEAIETFEEVIELYPTTQYAGAAMKELYAVEKYADNDYNSLKHYYETNDSIQADTVLTKLALYLINKCEIELQNWQTAIDHYEEIIESPESTADSIFAIIDLGYTYKLMGDSSARYLAMGKMKEHIPASTKSFANKRDYLLSLLPVTETIQDMNNLNTLKEGKLMQNVPNPFTNQTTIYFSLSEQNSVLLKVYDYTGKEIKSINLQVKEKGIQKTELDMSGFPSGIYFYSLFINGKLTDTKKMMVN